MNFLIKLKHWEIFLILLSIAIIVSIIDDPGSSRLKLVSNLIGYGVYTGWLWSIASFLAKRLKKEIKSSIVLLTASFLCFAFTTIYQLIKFDKAFQVPIPIYVVFLTSLFYCLVKIGVLLKEVERNNKMAHLNSIVYAILLLAFPIGVWVIQPKINKLFSL